ncbi:MAG: hypothetical protein NTV70_18830 [Acidobacteria bacterium]|nr:hypothetical protein [Acidobacteriota bacterium]
MVLSAALAGRLYRLHLHRQYRYLFAYALFSVLQLTVLLLLPHSRLPNRSTLYGLTWVVTEAILVGIFVLMVVELYGQILDSYPGIASLTRRIFSWTALIGIPLSLLTLLFDVGDSSPSRFLSQFQLLQRGILTCLMLLVFVMVCFLAWFPMRLNRNTAWHAAIFFCYFLSKSGLILVLQLAGVEVQASVSTGLMAMSLGCLVAWSLALTKQGEQVEIRVGQRWSEAECHRLLGQLEGLNSALSRVPGAAAGNERTR